MAKAKKMKAALKATPKSKGKSKGLIGFGASAVGKVASAALGKVKFGKGGKGIKQHKTVKQLLKKAYDRRALRKLRMGNLGGARRDLRKKATIV